MYICMNQKNAYICLHVVVKGEVNYLKKIGKVIYTTDCILQLKYRPEILLTLVEFILFLWTKWFIYE